MRQFLRVRFVGLTAACLVLSLNARAGDVSAIVEDVSPDVSGIGLFEYLSTGAVLTLAEGDWLVLGYLHSCRQERITGGAITIGKNESTVIGGSVTRRRVECDGGNLQLGADQSDRAGVAVMRKSKGEIDVALTVHSLSPLFRINGAADTLTLESLDRPREAQNLNIVANRVDLAAHNITLRKGGLYRATAAEREIIFRVDKFARPGVTSLLSRLIPL
jgi:hypothetical protein